MEYLQDLQQIAPFNLLDQEVLASLYPTLQYQEYHKHTFIFQQEEPSQNLLFLILEGVAEVIVINEVGKESVVGLRRKYDFFGETTLLTGKSYPASVKAVENMKCLLVSKETFEALLEKSASFAGFFTRILADRMRELFHEVVLEQSYEAYGMESQPFRKRVVDIMSAPVITCSNKDTIDKVARIMADRRISTLVVINDDDYPVGVITETDLVTKVLTKNFAITPKTAGEVMNPHLVALPPEAFFYQALLAMVKHQNKHVAILDQGRLMGIVTVRDLVKSRSTGALTIVDSIESQISIEELNKSNIEVDKVLTALVAEKAAVPEIFEVITEFHDRLTRKVIEICEAEMITQGYGPPPVGYCWLTMGSGGRKEQTLRTDQDNALIYENISPDHYPEIDEYFSILSKKIVEGLVRCGFARCKGDVMASNPKWRGSLKEWLRKVDNWLTTLEKANIRMLTIFLDFRFIYGKKVLADALRGFIFKKFREVPIGLHELVIDDLYSQVPLGFFKQFITEKSKEHRNEIDLKRSACVHVVDCIRVFAFRDRIVETSTLGRLKELIAWEVIPQDDAEFYQAAYESLMMFRIRENLRKASSGQEPDNYINPYNLSKRESMTLKEALQAVDRLQSYTGSVFRVEGY